MAKRKSGPFWEMYPVGDVKNSNLKILSSTRGKNCKETIYRCAYVCCGKEFDINHPGLRGRLAHPRERCPTCSNKLRQTVTRNGLSCAEHSYHRKRHVINMGFGEHTLGNEDSYTVTPPNWPAPQELIGKWVEPR